MSIGFKPNSDFRLPETSETVFSGRLFRKPPIPSGVSCAFFGTAAGEKGIGDPLVGGRRIAPEDSGAPGIPPQYVSYTHRIHGAGIYANMTGVY